MGMSQSDRWAPAPDFFHNAAHVWNRVKILKNRDSVTNNVIYDSCQLIFIVKRGIAYQSLFEPSFEHPEIEAWLQEKTK
jgi:hypothetical protein